MKNLKTNQKVGITSIYPYNDPNTVRIKPNDLLDPSTDFELTLTVNMTEIINGQSQIAKRKDGNGFNETQVVRFSTNKGLETIKYDRIIDLNPVWDQRYFTYADAKNGFIEMNQTYSLDNFNAPSGESITKIAVVRFVKMNGQIDNTSAPKSAVRLNGTRWEFDVPTLDPKQIYVAQILLCWKNNKAVDMENTVLSKANVTKFVQNGNNYERTEQQLNGDKLRAVGNEKVLYNINFKTSQYANYTLKITKFEIP